MRLSNQMQQKIHEHDATRNWTFVLLTHLEEIEKEKEKPKNI